jgi:peptidyl-prolyl cis-trans isomerase C
MIGTSASGETVATVNGVSIDSSIVDIYLESRIQKPAAQATPAEREAVMQEISDIYLITTQPIANELANDTRVKAQSELQYRGILAQAVATDFFSKNQATDEEILDVYQKQIELAPPLQFKARHILVETQAAAESLITQLGEGAEFAELATAHSTGPSGPSGGDLGWFSPEQMVKPFSDAVASMSDGEFTTEPVQTQFGWHVILREESRTNTPPTLESARDIIKQQVEQTKFQEFIAKLRADQVKSD